jgi:hypothetical protein
MQVVCLDLEGVLVPEIWIAFAERTGIAEFRRTTRDEPDYDKLMRWRLGLLRQHGLKLADIQAVIAGMAPMDGAKDFLDDLRSALPGHHPVGHLLRVCRPDDAPAGPAHAVLPPAGGRRRRLRGRLQAAPARPEATPSTR